jgi:MFS family permease
MIAGMGLIAAGSGLLPLVEVIRRSWQEGWLLATAALGGLGLALYLVNGIPFLMGATRPEERDHAFSAQMGLVPLAAFAGSLVGGALPGFLARTMGLSVNSTTMENPEPYRYALLLGAAFLVPAVWALLATKPVRVWPVPAQEGFGQHRCRAPASVRPRPATESTPVPAQESLGRHRCRASASVRPRPAMEGAPWGLIVLIALVAGLRYAGQSTTRTFFNVYLDAEMSTPTALIGTITAAAQLVAVPAALATPVLVARWSRGRVIVAGSLGQALSQSVLALVPSLGAAGMGYAGTMAMFQTTTSAFRVYSQELVSPRWRASMAASLMMGAGFTASFMALFGGFVSAALGYTNLFLLGAGLTVLGAAVFGVFSRRKGT